MRFGLFVVWLLLLLACAELALASEPGLPIPVPGIPIEGKLVTSQGWYMEGVSDNWHWLPPDITLAEPSPDERYFVHNSNWDRDLYRSDADGSNRTNLTASIGGTNCLGRWSPDGSQIVFQHSPILGDPDPEAPRPCWGPFQIWLVNADATGLHQVVGADQGGGSTPSFSPNGYCISYDGSEGVTLVDSDGTDKRVITGTGHPVESAAKAAWSRDGSALAVEVWVPATEGGTPGCWRQLVVIDPLGNNPRVVYQHFVADDVPENMSYWTGPANVAWSPYGDRISFAGMDILGDEGHDLYLPWPWWGIPCWEGVCGGRQLELYLVNADGQSPPVRATDDDATVRVPRWNGPNTAPEDPEVTVDNTTVNFSEVTGEGLTTIIRDDDPPALPEGYQFCGEYYNITTTAPHSGAITICMTYTDEQLGGMPESDLTILHYNEDSEVWEPLESVTVDPDTNTVCGQTQSLSTFGLAVLPHFGGFLQPINADGSSLFNGGRTVPVKFGLTDPLGNRITDAVAHLSCWYLGPTLVGTVPESATAIWADAGNTFRYDPEANQYIYNLSTKGMAKGTWVLRVTAEGWPGFEATVSIGLR